MERGGAADRPGDGAEPLRGPLHRYCLDLAVPADRATVAAAGATDRARNLVSDNISRFGTPLAVNLEPCRPAVRPRSIDAVLREWTGGRIRCRPSARPWWAPPRLSWRLPSGR